MTRRATDRDIASYFDSKVDCCAHKDAAKLAQFDRATTLLRRALRERVRGRTVLELGCGHGDLLRDLVSAGAASATGIDLSPARVEEAASRAEADGLAGRITFASANAAAASPAPHDAVVLDKVICCYADWGGLLEATLPAARRFYAYTLPRADGAWRALTPLWIGLENLSHAVRRNGFRAYAHDVDAIGRRVTNSGFRLIDRGASSAWTLAVYERA